MTSPLCLAVTLVLLQAEAAPPAPPAGPEQTPPSEDVARRAEVTPRPRDRKRTQYLLASSGLMLNGGEGSLSQTAFLLSSFSYGVTDHLTLQAGTVLPVWGLGLANGYGGLKVGGSPGERLHLSAAVHAGALRPFTSPSTVLGATLQGTATYGTPDGHVSLGVIAPVWHTASDPRALGLAVTLSGSLRVSHGVALMTEHWVVPVGLSLRNQLPLANAAAVRLLGDHWTVDLGLMRLPLEGQPAWLPLPWLDVTYTFG